MCPVLYQMLARNLLRSARTSRLSSGPQTLRLRGTRNVSTLPDNQHIVCILPRSLPQTRLLQLTRHSQYVHTHPLDASKSILTLLPSEPPNAQLAIGTCSSLPVTPNNFTANPPFLKILSAVYADHAISDPDVIQQASVFASPGGFNPSKSDDGSGGASHQGGAGGAGHGGWIHVSDLRNPPDFGRIAWPEDIIGSVEVDGNGRLSQGSWQDSGTYRVVTREGM